MSVDCGRTVQYGRVSRSSKKRKQGQSIYVLRQPYLMPSNGIPTKRVRAPLKSSRAPPLFTRANLPSAHASDTGSAPLPPLKNVHVTVVYPELLPHFHVCKPRDDHESYGSVLYSKKLVPMLSSLSRASPECRYPLPSNNCNGNYNGNGDNCDHHDANCNNDSFLDEEA